MSDAEQHWAVKYIGRPWEFGAQGPDAFDCWSFVRWVEREEFGVDLPAVGVPQNWGEANQLLESHQERSNWSQVPLPVEGDVVLMARNRHPVHVGVCVRANGSFGVLHCVQGSGVVFQLTPSMATSGWGRLTYFRRIP